MAETQKPPSMELFSGSSHQSLQNPDFRTAGNDIYTYNFNFSPSREPPASFWQNWGRVVVQALEYFQSSENRGALRLPSPETAAVGTGAVGVQYSVENAKPQQNPQGNEIGNGEERPPENSIVSEMADVDIREIKSQSTLSNAEIYTRSMLASNAGLPCWDPQPRSPVGDKGIVPGDVGTFDLIDGFTKIFNIWEDESLALQLPSNECFTRPSRFQEGCTVVNGILGEVRRSEDGSYIKSYRFHCKSSQGALLACTTSADLEQLVEVAALREFLIHHAGDVYQHANAIRRVADDESLYVVSGCIKSDSWALAAYQTSTDPLGEVLQLARRSVHNHRAARAPIYDWLSWMGEARFGSNSEKVGESYQGKDQSLFLRGFKLAFSRECRARLKATLRAKCNDGGLISTDTLSHYDSGFMAANQETLGDHGRNANDPPVANNKSRMGSSNSSPSTSLRGSGVVSLSGGMQVNKFPEISRPNFHPSDCITRVLMELTGSDCALCHDDDWRLNPRFAPAWSDISCIDIIASQTVSVRNGVVHLIPRAEDPQPQWSLSPFSMMWGSGGDLLPLLNPSADPENPAGDFTHPETSNIGSLAPPENEPATRMPAAPVKVGSYLELPTTSPFNRLRSTTPPSRKTHKKSLSDGLPPVPPRLPRSPKFSNPFEMPISSMASEIKTTTRIRSFTQSEPSNSLPVPAGWSRYVHPNGDVYYRNHQLRLTTPDDIRRRETRQYVLDAHAYHLEVISNDPNYARLPPDWETTISDVSESTAIIYMYSREAGQAYEWKEQNGIGRLVTKAKQHFWAFVAEYPSHTPTLPPNTEREFVAAVTQAKTRLRNGEIFPFTEQQIDQIIALYHRHKSANNIASLAWLLGAVMPLESIGSRMNGGLEALMEDLRL